MRPQPKHFHQRGISLVEAMVALAVMAFGTVAVLGVQATLRLNADVAKQRNEAVRIAQEKLEQARAFGLLQDYEGLASEGAAAVTGYTTNTEFQLAQAVADAASGPTGARRKTITVDVQWQDRAGQDQAVRLSSAVQGTVPELAGSLSVPSDASLVRNPGGRHPGIPAGAVPFGEGSSRFNPPGGGGIGWVFSNLTGYITRVCSGPAVESCVDVNARLLAGYVRFATGFAQPTGAESETPPSSKPPYLIEVEVHRTLPSAATFGCYEDQGQTSAIPYYCAVPVGTEPAWSGRSLVIGLPLAFRVLDGDIDEFRVCRYTAYREHRSVGTAPEQMRNDQHPLDYQAVTGSLLNQNFLVIRAGLGDVAPFDCPGDGPSPFIDSTTWHHQPPT